jgi:DNA-binding NtrC family response regulator
MCELKKEDVMRRIMLVDDEINVLHSLERAIGRSEMQEPVRVETYVDTAQALRRAGEVPFDVVVSDYRMPAMSGVEFLRAYRQMQSDTVRVILSASTEFDTLLRAINQAEVFRFMTKPWADDAVREVLLQAFALRDKSREDLRLFNELREHLGELTPQECEARRLEELEPGITRVNWGADGSVPLD